MESLGLLQPMRDASVAGDAAVLRKAVQWCEANGAVSVSDITGNGMLDEFVRSLGLKPIPNKKLGAALQPLQSLASQLSHRDPAGGGGGGDDSCLEGSGGGSSSLASKSTPLSTPLAAPARRYDVFVSHATKDGLGVFEKLQGSWTGAT